MMRKMKALIKREYWEQKNVFIRVPLAISAIMILAAIILVFVSQGHLSNIEQLTDPNLKASIAQKIPNALAVVSEPFLLILWLIVAYYFLGSLYDDRKDGSILFWQSMPISTTQTIFSKLITGLVLAPICSWIIMMITQLLVLIIVSIFLATHPVFDWKLVWSPGIILWTWVKMIGFMIFQGLWLLPIFAWFMLCSAFSKKAPALRALIPIILIYILEFLLIHWHYVSNFISSRIFLAAKAWAVFAPNTLDIVSSHDHTFIKKYALNLPHFSSGDWISFSIGIGVSVLFLVLGGVFRRRQ